MPLNKPPQDQHGMPECRPPSPNQALERLEQQEVVRRYRGFTDMFGREGARRIFLAEYVALTSCGVSSDNRMRFGQAGKKRFPELTEELDRLEARFVDPRD